MEVNIGSLLDADKIISDAVGIGHKTVQIPENNEGIRQRRKF